VIHVPAPGDVIADKYRLDRQIGKGSAGIVFEATHEIIGRRVAVKWLYPQLAQNATVATRFLQEARAANAVDHPNVVEIYDAGKFEDSLYLVLELLVGEPFSAYLERGAPSTVDLVRTLIPALRGVSAAHERGVVHRDLKPDNIFICRPRRGRSGGAKVLDFGISKLRTADAVGKLTGAGTFLGSPYYMAPEQIADSSTVDARADVYSAGVMLYEGLAGCLPFEGNTLPELFFKITNEKPRPPSVLNIDVSNELEAVVLRAMAPNPDERYPSMRALGEALEPFADGVVFETLDDGLDEVLGVGLQSQARPLPPVGSRTDQEVEELQSATTQISAELDDELRDSGAPMPGDRTERHTSMDLTPPPGSLEPVTGDALADRTAAEMPPASALPQPPPPPPPASRAMAAIRGEAPRDLEASPTKPIISTVGLEQRDGSQTTDPDVGQVPRRPNISTARTVELDRPESFANYVPPPARSQTPEPLSKSKHGINWVVVIGACVVISVATAVAVAYLR